MKTSSVRIAHVLALNVLALGCLFASAVPASAADYTVDKSHSTIGFKIKHMVSTVQGRFDDFSGTFSFDPAKPEDTKGEFVVKVASINTNDKKRDDHLRAPDFFNAKKYPEMTLKNIKLASDGGEHKYKMTGDLTLRGVTKPVTFDVDFSGTTKDPWGNTRAGFAATGKLNRKDFNIVWNQTLETGGLLLGEEVALDLQVEAIEGKPAEAAKERKALNKKQSQDKGNKKHE